MNVFGSFKTLEIYIKNLGKVNQEHPLMSGCLTRYELSFSPCPSSPPLPMPDSL